MTCCDHQVVGLIGHKQHSAATWNAALLDFCVVIQDFNIRGQRDEISHPGYVTESRFCAQCGAPVDFSALGLATYEEMIVSPVIKAVAKLQSVHARAARVDFVRELTEVDRIFFNHEDFLADYHRVDTDFVYDQRSGLYFVGTSSAHVTLLAQLYYYHTGKALGDFFEDADRFVLEGYGLLKSRAGHGWVYKGENFAMPAALDSIARDMKVMR